MSKEAPFTVALCYPSPYRVGMSSLGFQRVYRALMDADGLACERAFLDDECEDDAARPPEHPVTYESLCPIGNLPLLAFSVAYELEISGVVRMLAAAGIPVRRGERDDRHPLVVAGGPLTFSNPLPLSAIVDAIVVGEADARVVDVVGAVRDASNKAAALDALARIAHVFVPSHHLVLPAVGAEDDAVLPATSTIRTPHAELADMFLIEAERGCSRGCRYCVMRRSTNGGMRIVPADVVLKAIPTDAHRVGLVGAGVSDHPSDRIHRLGSRRPRMRGRIVVSPTGPPSRPRGLRRRPCAGRLSDPHHRDGRHERTSARSARTQGPTEASAAVRGARQEVLDGPGEAHLMVGTPGEEDADIDECVELTSEMSRIMPTVLGVAPFCPKRNTPLADAPFAGIKVIDDRLDRLRRGLRGRAEVRATSARWAWVEHVLAIGGEREGSAVIDAVDAGGSFRAYVRAFG